MTERLHHEQQAAMDVLQNRVSVAFKTMADKIGQKKRKTDARLEALEKKSVTSVSTLTDTTWTTPNQQRYQTKYPKGDGGTSSQAFNAMERRIRELEAQVEAMVNLGHGRAQ